MQNEELLQSRAEVEALLRQYTDLYDFAPVGYFTLARDGAILQVNLAGARLLGVEVGKLIRRRFGVFVSAKSRTTFNAFLEKAFGSQQKESCEVALERKGSAPLYSYIEASTEDKQECHAMVVDITERKRMELALAESEIKFKWLYEYAPSAYHHLTPDGTLTDVNHRWCELLGYRREDVLGRAIFDFVVEEER